MLIETRRNDDETSMSSETSDMLDDDDVAASAGVAPACSLVNDALTLLRNIIGPLGFIGGRMANLSPSAFLSDRLII